MRARPAAVLLLSLGALVLACGAEEGEEPDDLRAGFAAVLEYLPDQPNLHDEIGFVVMADLDRLHAKHGIDAPGEGEATLEAEQAYLERLSAEFPVPAVGFLGYAHGAHEEAEAVEVLRPAFALGPSDAQAWGLTQGAGEPAFAMLGNVDEQRSLEALEACADCTAPERDERPGGALYHWEEPVDVLALGDGHLLRAASADAIEAQVAAIEAGETLAAVEGYRQVAEQFDRLEAVEVSLAAFTQSPEIAAEVRASRGDDVPGEVSAAFEPGAYPTLLPYEAMGSGWGLDGGEPVTQVVLAHGSDEVAEENAGRIEERFEAFVEADLFAALSQAMFFADTHQAIDVDVRGRVVTATLHGGEGAPYFHQVDNPLFLHE